MASILKSTGASSNHACHACSIVLFCLLFRYANGLGEQVLLGCRREFFVGIGSSLSAYGLITSTSVGGDSGLAFAADNEPSGKLIPGGTAPFRPQGIGVSSWDPPLLQTDLGRSRLMAKELSQLQQPIFGGQELYYPPFLFGAWNVTATLRRKIYPYGTNYLPSTSLLEGSPRNREEQVGDTTTYEIHYFSTLANTLANQATVNLGLGVPETKIIQDRAYSAVSLSNAYRQLAPVQSVEWEYRQNPTKVELNFGTGILAEDMRPLGPRRSEVYINARTSDDSGDSIHYATAERKRSLTIAGRDVIVADTETITEFAKASDDKVTAFSRIAVYLTPNPNSREGVLWEQTGGKAVAFFDYELDMNRIKETFVSADGSTEERACVRTPKDVIQCA